jgi:DNA-binding beta-propeller fold protein YncE
VALSADGHTAYVTNQAENTISILSVNGLTLTPQKKITVGTHPNSMLLDAKRNQLYVSNGDNDTVSVVNTLNNEIVHTISLAPYKGAPTGSSPTNMTLSPDGSTLYVTNSGNNDVAVVNVSDKGDGKGDSKGDDKGDYGRIKGLIPTGWYPTGVQVAPDGKLLVTSAKGLGTGSNKGKDPANPQNGPYIESLLQGYMSIIPAPSESQLEKYTEMVQKNNGFDEKGKVKESDDAETIIPRHPGEESPIKHVIYVVKENRTYDQVLGDLGKGNGDPSLTLFGKDVTPNQHKLAEQFVTLDNFYADGEVSQDGWDWATEANSNPYNQLATHQGYAGNGSEYDSSGYLDSQVTAGNADPNRAFLWDAAAAAGKTFRHYGMHSLPSNWFGPNNQVKCQPGQYCAYEPLLNDNTDHNYPWFDMWIPDMKRYEEWNKEFQQYVTNNNLPTFQFIDLPRDHTAGGATAKELVADNDMALGKIVDTVSHSKYWKDTAIFVVEDDAQGGVDHVDGHRTIAQVISPYTQRGIVDSHFYSQVSMLRTMELLVGMKPLTQYDAAAMPMIYSFGNKPNYTAYDTVIPPTVNASLSNPVVKPGESVTVTAKVTNPSNMPLSGATARMVTPDGWTATPSTIKLGTMAPGASTDLSWTVTAPASAQYGRQQLTVQVDYPVYGKSTASSKANVTVSVPDANMIPQSQMKATATSEELVGENDAASQAIDGNPSTFWHTKWDKSDVLPQSITLNLGGTYDINKLAYLPRQTGDNGIITGYNIYVSTDGTNFTKVTSGTWSSSHDEKIATFPKVSASYVKLEATAAFNGWASAAEINVFKAGTSSQTAGTAQPTNPSVSTQSAVSEQSVMKPENMVGQPDSVDPQKLNEEIWRAVKGPNVPYPAPKHNFHGPDNDDR